MYLRKQARQLPFWTMVTQPVDALRLRAEALVEVTGRGMVVDTLALPGAGSAPGVGMASVGISLRGDHLGALRRHDPPVIARVRDGATVLDLRSVDPEDDDIVRDALAGLPAT
jgi:L-seryl-tRNA(Ser) seleniumtransferase